MTKRISGVLAVVVLLITLVVTGCGNQLTMQEYYDQLGTYFKDYVAVCLDFDTLYQDFTSAEQADQKLSQAKEICSKAKAALDNFAKMNPPSQYSEKHKELVKSIDYEKEYWDKSEKIFTAKTDSEIKQFAEEADGMFDDIPSEQQFQSIYRDLYLSVKTEVEK